jgi:phosphoserine aminotransferase
VYYCANETIRGVEFPFVPETGAVPLVADMTSDLLTRPLDVARFGLVFASAQKNLGPAGLTVVIVREDLIGHARPETPGLYDYALHVRERSMANTPPTFAWYMAGLVLKWLKREGGVAEMERRSRRRAEKLYTFIDASELYRNDIDPACRSRLNVTFRLADAALEPEFLRAAAAEGLTALAGHRSVGGLRASLYNAMPEAGVDALIEFMREFERRYG